MECKNPGHSTCTPRDSPAGCVSSSQGIYNSKVSRKDSQVTFWSPTTSESSPASQDSRVTVVSPTGAAHTEVVHVSPPESLNMSTKSRISIGPICRICHEGEAAGTLIRPCWCSGTMATVHRICLERWLNMATSEKCELCGYNFHLRYTSRPFWEFLVKCDNTEARRAFKVDLVCLMVLTPMAALSVYLCSVGALQYTKQRKVSFAVFTDGPNRLHKSGSWKNKGDVDPNHVETTSGWEAMMLVGVAVLLIIIYTCWASITLKYHIRVWRQWRVVHQDVALAYGTPSPPPYAMTSNQISSSGQDPESPPAQATHTTPLTPT